MDDSSVTISGHPGVLATFSDTFGPGVFIHKTTVDSLYHAPIHDEGMRRQILLDIFERKILFPNFSDLHTPIRSTYTGELVMNTNSKPLIETVLDLLLTQAVNWHLVVDKVVEASESMHIQLLNVGPGTGLARAVERAFNDSHVMLLDLTTLHDRGGLREKAPKQEPIAIIGMATNMPGALNTSQLWETLERGINTIGEVRRVEELKFISDYLSSRRSRFQNIDSAYLTTIHKTTVTANVL